MNIAQARDNMIRQQLRTQKIIDDKILNLIDSTSREAFVPKGFEEFAYTEMNIPIGHQQVMMTPFEEAMLLQSLAIEETEHVLEIGTGTGYLTALLAQLSHRVTTIDIFPEFTQMAQQNLKALHLNNIDFVTGDASKGWSENAPYDVIAITASMPLLAKAYLKDLNLGGRLFAVIGTAPAMSAFVYTREQENDWQSKNLFETVLPEMLNSPQPEQFQF